MKFAGKTFREYFIVSRKFLIILFILMIVIVSLRQSNINLPIIEGILTLSGVIVIGWAGWTSARKYKFNLKQIGTVGFILSFAAHCALPFFHKTWEVLYLIVVNSITYAVITIIAGWFAKRLEIMKSRRFNPN